MKYSARALGRFTLTHVAIAALGLASSAVWGLGLGRLNVQSSLGETLKAEIDISSLTPEEAGTLKARIAPPESYRSTGVEYNAVLTGTQVQLARRADGTPYLRVASDRAVQEPFVDLILELNWSSGRLVREFTLLFDPPSNAKPAAATVAAAPVVSAAPAPVALAPAPVPSPAPSTLPAPVLAPTPAPAPIAAAPTPAPAPAVARQVREAAAPVAAPAPAPASALARAKPDAASRSATPPPNYAVQPGDSLSKVASKLHPPSVSLDQMLVGLYRSNPDAFVDSNMNRLKAGVVLQVPSEEEASSLTRAEARQLIKAQSADFGAYRQRLASGAPALKQDESERRAKGRVQAAVEDRKPAAAPAPDKLTLSKAGGSGAELKASKETEKKDAAARMAELTRNVEELKKLSSAAKPVAAAATPSPTPSVAAPASTPASKPTPMLAAAAPAVVAAASALPLMASAPAVVRAPLPAPSAPTGASKAVGAASAASTPAPALQVEEPGVLEQLLANPLVLPVAGGLLALLGAFGLYRLRSRKQAGRLDTSFNESRLQPDSFFGATGGQRVDTRDGGGAASSMSYSLSQLDAIGDVDPVAEADVYLAYGRDLQAEEILKEALRSNPERLAIRLKLLEVYAKRRDTKGFEQLAVQLYAETHGIGDDWARAQELGRQIDPENPLYQPGGAPAVHSDDGDAHVEPMNASTLPQTAHQPAPHLATEPMQRSDSQPSGPMSGFDLDLDLDLDAPSAPVPAPASPIAMDATQAMAVTIEQAPLEMDFDLSKPPTPEAGGTDIEFDLDLPDEVSAVTAPAPAPSALDFDLSSIDLDLPEAPQPAASAEPAAEVKAPAAAEPADGGLPDFEEMLKDAEPAPDHLANALEALSDDDGDPLVRQLELADEFRQIGDTEGARDVLQELITKASGPLRAKAQALLDELR